MIDVTKPLETSDGVAIDTIHNSIYPELGDYYVMPREVGSFWIDSFWFDSKTGVARKEVKGDPVFIMPFTVRNVNSFNVGDKVAKHSDPTVLFGTIISTTATGEFPIVVETVSGPLVRRSSLGKYNGSGDYNNIIRFKPVVVRHEYHRLFACGGLGSKRLDKPTTTDTVGWLKTTYTNNVATFSIERP